MSTQYFENPTNGYRVSDGNSFCWLGPILLGGIYFAIRGNWSWFFIYGFLILTTLGGAYFVIPFFTRKINRIHLLLKGYKHVG